VLVLAPALTMVAVVLDPSGATASSLPAPARSASSPVDLATPVDMADGMAHRSAIVREGNARFEVLGPTLLRLEYSPKGNFENSPTETVVNRSMPVPGYRARVSGGWLTIETSQMTFRYQVGSGPFSVSNTSLRLDVAGQLSTVHPTWEWECPFGQTCQAGAAQLNGGASLTENQNGYQSSAGYIDELFLHGATATWTVLGAAQGEAVLAIRYTNVAAASPSPIVVVVNGQPVTTLEAVPTDAAQPWSTLTTFVHVGPGTNSVRLLSPSVTGFALGVDSISLGPAAAAAPVVQQTDPLGGWIRGFDTDTYGANPACPPGSTGDTCQADLEPIHTDGLLDGAGWRLLDDTQTAVWTRSGWVQPRPAKGDIEDGYLFAYGRDYDGALQTLARLTGSAPLLPRSVFGVWYSDFTPYTSAYIEKSLYPAFRSNQVPLNTLSLDTDWKAPNAWNGWEWNTSLFPQPASFLNWAHANHIAVTLNIHSSIEDNDPRLPAAEHVAGKALKSSTCTAGACKVWDWSSIPEAESNFSLQQSFLRQGVSFWWLDWCCDESTVDMAGLTPDSWIGHLYAQQMVNQGERGFVLARIGSSNDDPEEVYPAGPWSDHTSAIAFTGDAWGTWNTLAQEVALSPDEASIGEPYVSDDIGSYLGPPPLSSPEPADLYDRWVQAGTFQPILRLHSEDGKRLPWQYPQPVRDITEDFLRLRDALLPYTYTLAAQAHRTGLPITQPLYLEYPDQLAAYANPDEYLYGSNVLVAPVTSPGNVADTTVWFPPGHWVDYFTGATFTGPSTTTLSVPLDRMPVFVRAGGIVPEETPSTSATTGNGGTTVLDVYGGAPGSFELYRDSGSGLGYTKGQSTLTSITDGPEDAAGGAGTRVTIAPSRGDYPGRPAAVRYQLRLVDVEQPSRVTVNGRRLDGRAWTYQAGTQTVLIGLGSVSTGAGITVVASGATPVDRSEPLTPES
jgi:hypothetical protein